MLKDSQLPAITFVGMAALEVADGSSQQATAGPTPLHVCVSNPVGKELGQGVLSIPCFLKKNSARDYYF